MEVWWHDDGAEVGPCCVVVGPLDAMLIGPVRPHAAYDIRVMEVARDRATDLLAGGSRDGW